MNVSGAGTVLIGFAMLYFCLFYVCICMNLSRPITIWGHQASPLPIQRSLHKKGTESFFIKKYYKQKTTKTSVKANFWNMQVKLVAKVQYCIEWIEYGDLKKA